MGNTKTRRRHALRSSKGKHGRRTRRSFWEQIRRMTWPQFLLSVVFVFTAMTLSIGYYVVDLFLHPSIWNTFVFLVAIGFVGVILCTNAKYK